ncbi:HK97 gp10 family phage protein [Streptomyces hiroshimensis]|uniref:HK97 gp10 family phage protein n=1 Tax=Streptomyces hiroshimensis TaxID=66424 RepID=A0ABQ2Y407_9ACTN|nr:HK97 gp10 family phage protein [Streptomyces hiroshimensis]GGX63216.1 hypothetical protein GCM10010324_04960 [Streptomyces hiroshimensis]
MPAPKVRIRRAGVRQLLNDPALTAALVQAAEQIRAAAEATSPTDVGRYKASFSVESRRRIGTDKDRTGAAVVNSSPHARFVEYGGQHTPARHTLLRAATSTRL